MSTLDQFRMTFFQECDELLSALEPQLFMLNAPEDRPEAVNGAFRAVHSIKGGAAMFGFGRLIAFAHAFETALDAIRNGKVVIDGDTVEKLLRAADALADLAEAARADAELPQTHELPSFRDLALIAGTVHAAAAQTKAEVANSPTGSEETKLYRIVFQPNPNILKRGGEPLALIKSLQRLGPLKTACDPSRLPPFGVLDPAVNYLSWIFELETQAPAAAIRDIFSFVADGAVVDISPLNPEPASVPEAPARAQGGTKVQSAPSGRTKPHKRSASIRIDLDRVERLVDLIGEVTIAQAMVLQYVDKLAVDSNPLLFRALGQLQQLTRGLQDGVMAIRAQPIRTIFSRMPRVVRDVAQETGRQVQVEMSGEETEIDKTIVEQLTDPLIHIVRNAVDHGIEPAEDRRAQGKPEAGTVRLSAAQQGGRIVIEVSDDGRGIDRDAVRQKAVERGLIAADAALSDEQIDNLIFLPGLSTASTISGVSGRGVGMDVVRRNIQAIGGRVSMRSHMGAGTTTIITLPLTLAVLDGMLVRAASESYLIPLSNVAECFVTSKRNVIVLPGSGEVVGVRGQHIPTVHLARRLGLSKARLPDLLQVVVVETENAGKVGVIVDEIHGNQQIVVKSITGACGELTGIAGATILGDGSIALILDVSQLAGIKCDHAPLSPFPQSNLASTGTFAA